MIQARPHDPLLATASLFEQTNIFCWSLLQGPSEGTWPHTASWWRPVLASARIMAPRGQRLHYGVSITLALGARVRDGPLAHQDSHAKRRNSPLWLKAALLGTQDSLWLPEQFLVWDLAAVEARSPPWWVVWVSCHLPVISWTAVRTAWKSCNSIHYKLILLVLSHTTQYKHRAPCCLYHVHTIPTLEIHDVRLMFRLWSFSPDPPSHNLASWPF